MRGLSLRIGGARFALPLRDIAQVLALPVLRPLAGAAPEVAGLLNLHGEGVVVIDLALACASTHDGCSPAASRRSRIALLQAGPAGGASRLGLLLHEPGAIVEVPTPLSPCPAQTGSLPIFAGLSLLAGSAPGHESSLLWFDVPALRDWLDAPCRDSGAARDGNSVTSRDRSPVAARPRSPLAARPRDETPHV